MVWRWPLRRRDRPVPRAPEPGAFGAHRKHDTHTGIDLYADPGAEVLAVEDGRVVAIEDFTGPAAGSPWWNDTRAVLVEGASGVVLYGEIDPCVKVGERVTRGDVLGHVRTVLRHDKGLPMTMLHFELYVYGTCASVWWKHEESRPFSLLDPTDALVAAEVD
jgi:murein DD-endopeptidase MepM/ murein hydrolase activator NlpD